MTVITRFAPSPTGFLHIGGARTALFNWLFSRHHEGTFLLRIEDTDRKRSTKQAIQAITDGLKWLELNWDGQAIFQSDNRQRHVKIAQTLLEQDRAYLCYCLPDELNEMREQAKAEGRQPRYDGRWRDRNPNDAPPDVKPSIRFKAPTDGTTVIHDRVQGHVEVKSQQLDDMIILRADGTPTYMLSVVVDDHDMGVTDVIRGDDHLTNAFRQIQLYRALGWQEPRFAHVPLIHGSDGSKMSKRHGSLAINAYQEMGFLSSAIKNYLLRLGWSHGDDEIISMDQAIDWFDLPDVGRGPSRFDIGKLENLNAHYLRELGDSKAVDLIEPTLSNRLGHELSEEQRRRLNTGITALKPRAKTLTQLAENSFFYIAPRPIKIEEKAGKLLNENNRAHLLDIASELTQISDWNAKNLESSIRDFAKSKTLKLGQIAQPLRASLTGAITSPGIFEVMETLGRTETIARLRDL
mgnify:CR=1 FL=1